MAFGSAESELFGIVADKDYALGGVDWARADETIEDSAEGKIGVSPCD